MFYTGSRPARKRLKRRKLHNSQRQVHYPGDIVLEGDLPEWDRPGRFVGLRPFTLEQLLFL